MEITECWKKRAISFWENGTVLFGNRCSFEIVSSLQELGQMAGPSLRLVPLTWKAQDKWRQYQCRPALVAQFCSLGTVPKTAPISEYRRDAFSKRNRAIFPTSSNFQNYLIN